MPRQTAHQTTHGRALIDKKITHLAGCDAPTARNGQDDIYIQRVNGAGASQWTADGVALAVAPNNKFHPKIISDGTGGAIVVWHDFRNGNSNADIYIQRVTSAGVPQWTDGGIGLCTALDHQFYPALATDGAGGAIVTWTDHRSGMNWDIYVQWLDASGTARWFFDENDLDGVPLSKALNPGQSRPKIIDDGAGGAIVTWHDVRNGFADIFAQGVNVDGVVAVPETVKPSSLVVRGIYPNPFSSRGTLGIQFNSRGTVRVELFDVAGRRVRSASRRDVTGRLDFVLDDRDDQGRSLPNGVYFCRIQAAGETHTVKLGIVR